MKSSRHLNLDCLTLINRGMLTLFTILGILLFSVSTYAQDVLSKEQTEEAFKSLAKYTSGAFDKTSQILENQGYRPPAYLQNEWKQFPAIRKIEMAYEAAENASKEGGQKFLALLSKNLAQKYEAVNHEESLKSITQGDLKPEKLEFKHPSTYRNVKLPKSVEKQIMSISKYTEVGALGGTRGVLKYQFGLSDDAVYDILRSSNSSKEALEKGLSKSKVPPSHQERLRNVSKTLQKNYEGARNDKALTDAANERKGANSKPNTNSRKRVTSDFHEKTQLANPNLKPDNSQSKSRYNSYTKTNYATPEAKKFGSMRVKRGGFGGVIFGNKVVDETNLPSLKQIRFIATEHLSPDGMPMGALEFIFEDGSEYVESSVLIEDILAANEIVFGKENEYTKGDGIGLAGIENSIFYPDSSSRWEVVVHPAIANFELGWAALFSDVFPIASNEMLEKLKEGSSEDDFYTGFLWSLLSTPQTWKIVDVPLAINIEENTLQLYRLDLPDSSRVSNAYITMQGFNDELSPNEEKLFYKIVPSLTNSIYEFHRINEFARVLALFRWAKEKGGKLINLPREIKYVSAPESVFITKEKRIKYYTLEEDMKRFVDFKNDVIDSIENELTGFQNKEISILHKAFLKELNKYNEELLKKWNLLLSFQNNEPQVCRIEVYRADSILATTNFIFVLAHDTETYLLDSLSNLLENKQKEFAEIELVRLLIISKADTLLSESAPDSLERFQILMSSLQDFNDDSEEVEKEFREKTLAQIDDLLSNSIKDYPLLLLYRAFSRYAIEEIEGELSKHEYEESSYRTWRRRYSEIIDILQTEKRVIESTRNRYCNK
jgi:hypothetical protein